MILHSPSNVGLCPAEAGAGNPEGLWDVLKSLRGKVTASVRQGPKVINLVGRKAHRGVQLHRAGQAIAGRPVHSSEALVLGYLDMHAQRSCLHAPPRLSLWSEQLAGSRQRASRPTALSSLTFVRRVENQGQVTSSTMQTGDPAHIPKVRSDCTVSTGDTSNSTQKDN